MTAARELRQAISAQDYVEAERLLLAYTASLARLPSDELPAALELLEWARRTVLAGRAICVKTYSQKITAMALPVSLRTSATYL